MARYEYTHPTCAGYPLEFYEAEEKPCAGDHKWTRPKKYSYSLDICGKCLRVLYKPADDDPIWDEIDQYYKDVAEQNRQWKIANFHKQSSWIQEKWILLGEVNKEDVEKSDERT